MKNKKVFFKTFGCRTNIYDTQIMIENIKDFEITSDEKNADIIVVNSCTVTNSADAKARNYISKMSKLNKKIIYTGCGAINKGKELLDKNKVFGVFGHKEKEEINTLLKNNKKFYQVGKLDTIEKSMVYNFEGKNRAFVKIQEGCNFKCSYCIIPTVRGLTRSQDEDKILTQIKILTQNNYSEFILTGTNIGSYGKDKQTNLGELLKKISQIKGVKRIRLGSIEPIQIDDSFKEILNESWLEKHLHIALQHTNEEMLKIMRRRNNYKDDKELLEMLSSKGFALGTDFIVGHPGEIEERFEDGFEKLKILPLTHIHCFIYSKRDNTYSATLKNEINGKISKQRLKKVVELINEKNYHFRKNNTTPLKVLIEEFKEGYFIGLDQFFNRIKVKSDKNIDKKWIVLNNFTAKKDMNYANF